MSEAIVVGAGPNGLACAALARARGRAGDGTGGARADRRRHHDQRTDAAGPAARRLLRRARDGGRRAVAERARPGAAWTSVVLARGRSRAPARRWQRRGRAALDRGHGAGLGADGRAWERVFGAPARGFGELSEDIMRPILHVPRHPLRLARASDSQRRHRRPCSRASSGPSRRARCGAAAPRTRSARCRGR